MRKIKNTKVNMQYKSTPAHSSLKTKPKRIHYELFSVLDGTLQSRMQFEQQRRVGRRARVGRGRRAHAACHAHHTHLAYRAWHYQRRNHY